MFNFVLTFVLSSHTLIYLDSTVVHLLHCYSVFVYESQFFAW